MVDVRSEAVRSTSISKDLEMLGAQIEIENGMISATAEELKGAHIYMDVCFCRSDDQCYDGSIAC